MADSLPLVIDETIYQGTTWRRAYRWLPDGAPQDFTLDGGWLARLQVRANYADVASGPPILSLTEQNGITLDADGHISWVATDEQTALMTKFNAKRYDLELEGPNGGDVIRFVMGSVTVSGEVSR